MHIRLLLDLTKREFKTRYLGSVLGSYWSIIHPLIMICIFTLIFSNLMKSRLGSDAGTFSYSIYLCTGLLPWNFFSEIVNRGATSLVDNAGFLKKLSFPPYVFFASTSLTSLINFFIAFSIFLVFLVVIKPTALILLPLYFLILILFGITGTGMAMALGCLNVFTRDFQQMTSVIFQLWFWFTPIVYLSDHLPKIAKNLLYFNPAYVFVESFHMLLYYEKIPPTHFWFQMMIWAAAWQIIGIIVYRKLVPILRDHL